MSGAVAEQSRPWPKLIYERIDHELTPVVCGVSVPNGNCMHVTDPVVLKPMHCSNPCHRYKCTGYHACKRYYACEGTNRALGVVACRMCNDAKARDCWVDDTGQQVGGPTGPEAAAYACIEEQFGERVYYFYEWHPGHDITKRSVDVMLVPKDNLARRLAIHVDGMHHRRQAQVRSDKQFDVLLSAMHIPFLRLRDWEREKWEEKLREFDKTHM